jgi:hypothetical protein
MHIMAATDLEAKELDPSNPRPRIYEKLLCTVKVYTGGPGVLESSPGFSEPIIKPEPLAWNADIQATLRNRNKPEEETQISSYRFRTPRGSVYEYTVENIGGVQDDDIAKELEDIMVKEDQDEVNKWTQAVGTKFVGQPPQFYSSRYNMFAEIVSATNFGGETLFIRYDVTLPPVGWKWPPELTEPQKGSETAATARLERMQYGVTQYSNVRYVGGMDERLKALIEDHQADENDVNRPMVAQGTTNTKMHHHKASHIADKTSGHEGSLNIPRPTAHFGHPLELQFISSTGFDLNLGMQPPKIFIQVYSKQAFNQLQVEGVGWAYLPSDAGMHDMVIRCWQPTKTIQQEMQDFFLGGAAQLTSAEDYLAVPYDAQGESFVSKYGFAGKTTGSVRFRANVIDQSRPPAAGTNLTTGKVMRRAVGEILNTLRLKKTSQQVINSAILSKGLRVSRTSIPEGSVDKLVGGLQSLKGLRVGQDAAESPVRQSQSRFGGNRATPKSRGNFSIPIRRNFLPISNPW